MKGNRLANAFRFNKLFWGVCCALLIGNLVYYMAFTARQRARIHRMQGLYVEMRKSNLPGKSGRNYDFLQSEREIQAFVEGLPERSQFMSVVTELYNALQRHRLSVSKMVYKPEIIEAYDLQKYTASFTVSGKYSALKALLSEIQNSRTYFGIEKLSFANQSGDEESVVMDLQIATYFR